jgi:hypothetical protein
VTQGRDGQLVELGLDHGPALVVADQAGTRRDGRTTTYGRDGGERDHPVHGRRADDAQEPRPEREQRGVERAAQEMGADDDQGRRRLGGGTGPVRLSGRGTER